MVRDGQENTIFAQSPIIRCDVIYSMQL